MTLPRVIVGTAGHIDHGKTSLVRRLTGIDTDRLPEEKRRGITIDLGFAPLDLPAARLGFVDVPGHEKFVRNMVAGAAGIDLALLAVAADDGVMPQTREHVAIMDLLGVRSGVVAITKCDAVDADALAFAQAELDDALAGTFLATAPRVAVSSRTGAGIDELRALLERLAAAHRRPAGRGLFRMPIDRVFSLPGHGTIVTGTVIGGAAATGDVVELAPHGTAVRLRRWQSFGATEDRVAAGQRAAANLAGVKAEDVRRGDELAAPGLLAPARRMLALLTVLPRGRPLADRALVGIHLGTREAAARVLTRRDPVPPGGAALVELRFRDPMLAEHGQRFVARTFSPAETFGGGTILDPEVPPLARWRDLAMLGAALAAADPAARLAAFLETDDLDAATAGSLARRVGIGPEELPPLLERLRADGRLARLPGDFSMPPARRDRLMDAVAKTLDRLLLRKAPARSVEGAELLHAARRLAAPAALRAVAAAMVEAGRLTRRGEQLGPAGRQAAYTKAQRKTVAGFLHAVQAGGLAPPFTADLARALACTPKELEILARAAAEDGLLTRVADGLYYDPEAYLEAVRTAAERLRGGGPATVAELKDAWGLSRKHAVPLCERLDADGVTVRRGDLRDLGPNAPPGD